ATVHIWEIGTGKIYSPELTKLCGTDTLVCAFPKTLMRQCSDLPIAYPLPTLTRILKELGDLTPEHPGIKHPISRLSDLRITNGLTLSHTPRCPLPAAPKILAHR